LQHSEVLVESILHLQDEFVSL